MDTPESAPIQWQATYVTSPLLPQPVAVIAAKDVPYLPHGNRLQTLNLYLPHTPANAALIGTPVQALPAGLTDATQPPRVHVHIHGGAWRDPQLSATSIEPTVAHAFAAPDGSGPIAMVASLNYTLTQFPTHPTLPYDAVKDQHSDPAREAVHPQHVHDVLHGFALLRTLGLSEKSYVLSGHSCGACIMFQAILEAPHYYGLTDVSDAPCPAALLGINGLYDLPALVNDLGPAHEHLREDYTRLLSNAFGADLSTWPAASPAHFDPATIGERVRTGKVPALVLLDQSAEDQLVPMNEVEHLEANLRQVAGLQVVRGHQATGVHAAPWERGDIIWHSVQDVLALLQNSAIVHA